MSKPKSRADLIIETIATDMNNYYKLYNAVTTLASQTMYFDKYSALRHTLEKLIGTDEASKMVVYPEAKNGQ